MGSKAHTLTDAEWGDLFGRYHAGERAKDLIPVFGITKAQFDYEARRRGMRLRDLPAGHPGRSRTTPLAQRGADYKHHAGVLSEGVWQEIMQRWLNGESGRVLAAEYGVTPTSIQRQARARGMLKRDHPGAKAAPRGLSVTPKPLASPELRKAMAFDLKTGDLKATLASLDERMTVAAARGLPEVVEHLGRMSPVLVRHERARAGVMGVEGERDGEGPLHHPSPEASDGPPPPMGEEKIELRDSQKPPEGDWSTWLFLGGRGAGKTLAGAMWLSDMAEALGPRGRLALIGPTLHDVREVMIEGVSGIAGLPRWTGGARPVFEPSRRRLTFPNGAVAYAFSAEDPDSLRGPQFGAAWADELCAWPRTRGGPGETLALLRMGLRLGARPRLFVSTTPRPIAALRHLRAEADCIQTHAATRDNADHLAAGFLAGLERLYGGTRKAAQELEGMVVEAEGALFTAEMLARARGGPPLSPSSRGAAQRGTRDPGGRAEAPDAAVARGAAVLGSGFARRAPRNDGVVYDRVVVAIDPTTTASGNACGIVAAGRCGETVHVLADRSAAGLGPDGWARRAVRTAQEFNAAAIVAEVNQGGEMVQAVLRTAGCSIPVRAVRATKGKRVRAEPVAALYEQGRVTHAPGLGALEEELMAFGGEDEAGCDLDRADALVWAVTDLLIDRAATRAGPRISVLDWGVRPAGISSRAW